MSRAERFATDVASIGEVTACGHWMEAGKHLLLLGDGRRVCVVHVAELADHEDVAPIPQRHHHQHQGEKRDRFGATAPDPRS